MQRLSFSQTLYRTIEVTSLVSVQRPLVGLGRQLPPTLAQGRLRGREIEDFRMVTKIVRDPPKFVVDIDAPERVSTTEFSARISGRYLFGAPLAGENVTWSLSAKPAVVNGGSLAQAGLRFDEERRYWDAAANADVLRLRAFATACEVPITFSS